MLLDVEVRSAQPTAMGANEYFPRAWNGIVELTDVDSLLQKIGRSHACILPSARPGGLISTGTRAKLCC
jgi:hypothetical protein